MDILKSIWDFLQPYITMANFMTLVVYVLGLVVAKTGLDFVVEIKGIAETYKQAKTPGSPGGPDVTDKELAEIEGKVADAVASVWDEYKDTIFGFLGRLFEKIAFWK